MTTGAFSTILACQPIPWMFYAYLGPAPVAAGLLGGLILLLVVVAIKSAIFAYLMGRRRVRAFLVMVLANIISTAVGIFHSFLFMAPSLLLIGLGLLCVSGFVVGRFYAGVTPRDIQAQNRLAIWTAVATALLAIVAVVITSLAQSIAYDSTLLFLLLKALAFFIALSCGIALTVGWEGMVAAAILRREDSHAIVRAALGANVWTFLGVFLIGAIIALPVRLRRTDFLWPY